MEYLIYASYTAPFVVLGFLAFAVYQKVFGEKDYDASYFERVSSGEFDGSWKQAVTDLSATKPVND